MTIDDLAGSLEAHEQRKIKKKKESFDDQVLQTNVTLEEEAKYVQRNFGGRGFGHGRGSGRGYDYGREIRSYDCYNCVGSRATMRERCLLGVYADFEEKHHKFGKTY